MLFLWVTDWLPLWTREAVIEAWEFTFKTKAFVWVKTTRDGSCFPMGTGYYTRANPEDCLLTTRGRSQRLSRKVKKLIIAPRRAHSQRPDEIYERIEAVVAGPYLKVFARFARPGWDRWGTRHCPAAVAVGHARDQGCGAMIG